MNRRGILGMFAGAAVAGPSMAKEALSGLAVSAPDLSLIPTAGYTGYGDAAAYETAIDPVMRATKRMAQLVGMTTSDRAKHKRRLHVQALDPDIAAYRSISLAAKLEWQKERQLEAMIADRKTMLQRVLDGLPGYDSEDDYL